MTMGLPAEVSEFLVNALESHDGQRLQDARESKGWWRSVGCGRGRSPVNIRLRLCVEKRREGEDYWERGKVGGNDSFTAQSYWLIPPQPDDTSLMIQPQRVSFSILIDLLLIILIILLVIVPLGCLGIGLIWSRSLADVGVLPIWHCFAQSELNGNKFN